MILQNLFYFVKIALGKPITSQKLVVFIN